MTTATVIPLAWSHRRASFAATAFLFLIGGCTPLVAPQPADRAELREPCQFAAVTDDYHGELVTDRYRWLEDLTEPCVSSWIEQRNVESERFLESAQDFRTWASELVAEFARIQSGSTRVEGGFLLSEEGGSGDNLPVYLFARPGMEPGTLIDPEALGIDPASTIRHIQPSPDGEHVAFGLSPAGQRLMSIRVAHVATQRLLPDRIEGVKYSGASWANNSREFVYSKYTSPGTLDGDTLDRGPLVAVHRLGTEAAGDTILLKGHATAPDLFLGAELSDDGQLLLVWDWSGKEQGEDLLVADLVDAETPRWRAPLRAALGRRAGHHRYIGGSGQEVYLQTSLDAAKQRIVRLRADRPDPWETVVAEDSRPLQHSAFTDGHLVLSYRKDVITEIDLYDVERQTTRQLELPSPGSAFVFQRGPRPNSVSFLFDSFTRPPTGYEVQPRSGRLRPLAAPLSELEGVVTNQHFAKSKDGTSIPFFLVSNSTALGAASPTLLVGYGASRGTLEPEFDAEWVTWLKMGGKLVLANIRGGAEYGEEWYAAATLANKQNSFDDFIAIAERLIEDGETNRNQLVAYGSSNGGLLMAAVMVQRPDLFAAILADVGIYDALRFPLFTAGPRWVREMGDARIPEEYPWVRAWSPIHNLVADTCYPATFLTTAQDDDLVHPSQSYKFAAALSDVQGCPKPILLRAYPSGGHSSREAHGLLSERAADRLTFAAIESGLAAPAALLVQSFDLLIEGGRVMDPDSGLDAIRHIGITDGVIQAISETPLVGKTEIDATGRVVAPGFIDLNTYQHSDSFFRLRVADGVTSVLHLEGGAVDVSAYYDALEGRALIHHGISVSHGGLRLVAQGDTSLEILNGMTDMPGINETRASPELDDRPLTPAELDTLAALVEQGLREGAVAVGFGIAYTPGTTHSEILRMVELAARYDASAHLHLRDWDATREWGELYEVFAAAIHTGGDLHVNHLQSHMGSFTEPALTFIDRARSFGLPITTECYPYTAALTSIDSALFDDWETRSDENLGLFEWPPTGERLTRESFGRYREQGGVVIIHARDEARQEAAVQRCLAHPLPMVASDGAWDDGKTHPRSAGTNSRILGRYVREKGVLTLMEALRKMSLAPAQHLERRVPAMHNKGRIRMGADADLVIFDPATVIDRATYREPTVPPAGIEAVLVGGVPVVRSGVIQDGVFPGRPIRGPMIPVPGREVSASRRRGSFEQADEVVRAHLADRRIPGASIAIITADGGVETAAFGTAVIQHNVAAKVDTVYEIASLTKQFTATAVLMLCDEGKLDLDDPIDRYIEAAPEAWRGITVRHLLTHTAGIAPQEVEFASLKGDWRRYSSRELMLASAIADPVVSPPGERFQYSSEDYFLAALAVEKASGVSFREFMRQRIFEPLGMAQTLMQDELRIIPNEAQGYSLKHGELVNIWRDAVEETAGGWGMFSNIPDLVRWDRALRDQELLSPESYAAMFSPTTLKDGSRFRYGLGWWLPERNGIPYQYHSGITGTELLRIPSRGLTVIVLTNLGRSGAVGSDEANPWGLADAIASALVPEFALETKNLPLSPKAVSAYTGRWRFVYGEATLFEREGRLWIEDSQGADPMLYQGDDTFGFDGDSERLVFHRSADGAVTGAQWIGEVDEEAPGVRVVPEGLD